MYILDNFGSVFPDPTNPKQTENTEIPKCRYFRFSFLGSFSQLWRPSLFCRLKSKKLSNQRIVTKCNIFKFLSCPLCFGIPLFQATIYEVGTPHRVTQIMKRFFFLAFFNFPFERHKNGSIKKAGSKKNTSEVESFSKRLFKYVASSKI